MQKARPKSANDAPEWQLQAAKARFSEVVRLAAREGPQRVTRNGNDAVVIVSAEHYNQLLARERRPKSLLQFFRQSPLVGVKLDLARDKDPGRNIDL